MRAVVVLVLVLVVVVVVAMLIANARERAKLERTRWRVVNRSQPDESIVVGIERGDEFRTVKAVLGADTVDVVAELRLAREDAELLAAELNAGEARR
jgi:hypothetical protein